MECEMIRAMRHTLRVKQHMTMAGVSRGSGCFVRHGERGDPSFARRNQCGTRYFLHRNQCGATAIEFALIAPFYFLLIIGIMETSMVMFAQHVLESAAANASRLGKTGYVATTKTQQVTIMQTVQNLAGFLMDSTKITVNAQAYKSLGAIGTGEAFIDANANSKWDVGENYTDSNGNGKYDNDVGVAGYGGTGDIVVYTISYPWPIMTPAMGLFIGTNNILTLQSRVVVKNEPYD
jgi:Flp pilus assembly protein TadG